MSAKPMICVERRAQLMAHVGEEFGFGAVGALGLGLLFEILFGEFGELLRLVFERLARLAQVGDGGRQTPFAVEQLALRAASGP